MDNSVYTLALRDNLQNAVNVACADIPVEVFEINELARYVKVILETQFPDQHGVGLQYFDMVYGFE